jgi:hypothetical protein
MLTTNGSNQVEFKTQNSIEKINFQEIQDLISEKMASQKYVEDTNTVKYMTNDTSLIKDSLIIFTVDIENAIAGEKVVVESSNPNVAYVTSTEIENGDKDTVKINDFGRTVITATIKNSPHLKMSFPVYVEKSDFSFFDSIYNIQIESKDGRQYLDPMDQKDNYLVSHHDFYAKNMYRASDFAFFEWEVSPAAEASILTDEINKDEIPDSIRINFAKGGKYTLFLKQKSNSQIVDSLNFFINLDDSLKGDLSSGMMPHIRDFRDGRIYTVDYFKSNNDGKTYAVFTESLKFLPFIYPYQNITDAETKAVIAVLNNTTSYSVDYVKNNMNYDSIYYNYRAAMKFGDMAFGDFPLQATIDADYKQGLCPDGWYVPLVSEIQYFGTSDVLDQDVFDRLNLFESTGTGLKSGYRNFNDVSNNSSDFGYLMSRDRGSTTNEFHLIYINPSNRLVVDYETSMFWGTKIRCIKLIDHKVYE